jgi:hypothetical protein
LRAAYGEAAREDQLRAARAPRGRTDAALVSAVLRDQLATNTRSARAPHRLLGLHEAKAAFESELDPDADVREMRARLDQLQMLENIKPLIDRR